MIIDAECGRTLIRETIKTVNALEISAGDEAQIFAGDACCLLELYRLQGASRRLRAGAARRQATQKIHRAGREIG